VDVRDVCRVEGVVDEAGRGGRPHLVELADVAVPLGAPLRDLGQAPDGLVEGDPDDVVADRRVDRPQCRLGRDREALVELRDVAGLAVTAELPPVVGAHDAAVADPADGELGRPVGALVVGRGRSPVAGRPHDDVLAEDAPGERAGVEVLREGDGIPERAECRDFADEHGWFLRLRLRTAGEGRRWRSTRCRSGVRAGRR
jgi:hypothetical protein